MHTKTLIASTVAILAATADPSRGAPAATDLPRALAVAVHEFDQAQVRNDTATLSRLVADDYLLVNSDASMENKRQFLVDFELPGFKIEPYVMEGQVRKVWSDAALVAGQVQLRWTQDGARHERLLRIAHVWARRRARWRLAYTQVTRVPDQR